MTDNEYRQIFFGLKPGDRIMVAYSGGVDSSYAAELCREAGFRVETVTMRLFDTDGAVETAAKRAAEAGFPHHILDLSDEFREEIMHRAWKEYSAGLTPNPCAVCNPVFKFGKLRQFAMDCGCAAMVTGHYAKILQNTSGTIELRKGNCIEKDQSYFLFAVPREALAFCRTPLGFLEKSEVRKRAEAAGLSASSAKDSQDICFGGDSMPETLSALFPEPAETGNFLDDSGKILGQHRGIQFYTIGQRKGTGIALGCPAYVSRIDGNTKEITISKDPASLMSTELRVRECCYLADLPQEFRCEIRIRYRSKAVMGTVSRKETDAVIKFDSPVRAAAPGQAAVFYAEDHLLGGGWIDRLDYSSSGSGIVPKCSSI